MYLPTSRRLPLPAFLALLSAISSASAQTGPSTKLAITNLVVSASDGGAAATRAFGAGDPVHLRFDVTGARRTNPDDDTDPQIRLRYRAELQDSESVPLAQPISGEVIAALAPEDKNWQPRVRLQFELPTGITRGQARLRISLTDEVANASTQAEADIPLTGPPVLEATSLAAVNFDFFRKEDDETPLTVAAYRPGDTVWGRFDIVGFARGEGNRYAVSYGLEVLDSAGKSLYQQEQAADVQSESVYPRRFVPAVLSLQLTRDTSRGPYVIRLYITDKLSGKQSTSDHRFAVE